MKYNELNKIIMDKLGLDTFVSDVLEYMLLEKAGLLGVLSPSELQCKTQADSQSNIWLENNPGTSVIIFGFMNESAEHQSQVVKIAVAMMEHFPKCIRDFEAQFYKTFPQQVSFVFYNSDLEQAIESSSLVKATGNIEELTVAALDELKKNVLSYRVNDSDLALGSLINQLTNKIDTIMQNRVTPNTFFSSASPTIQPAQKSDSYCILL